MPPYRKQYRVFGHYINIYNAAVKIITAPTRYSSSTGIIASSTRSQQAAVGFLQHTKFIHPKAKLKTNKAAFPSNRTSPPGFISVTYIVYRWLVRFVTLLPESEELFQAHLVIGSDAIGLEDAAAVH